MSGNHGGKNFACPLGLAPLKGTGYESCNAALLGPGLFGGGFFGGGNSMSADPMGASTG